MAFIEDLSSKTYCHDVHRGVAAFSVGWLGNSVPSSGTVPADVLNLLRYAAQAHYYEDGLLGCHVCEICGEAEFHGEFWLEFFDRSAGIQVRFVLPTGIIHYIEQHGYCPPAEFLEAVAPVAKSFAEGSV